MKLERLQELAGLKPSKPIIKENYDVEYKDNESENAEFTSFADKQEFEKFADDFYSHLVNVKSAVHEAHEFVSTIDEPRLVNLAEQLIKDYKQFTSDVQNFIELAKLKIEKEV